MVQDAFEIDLKVNNEFGSDIENTVDQLRSINSMSLN